MLTPASAATSPRRSPGTRRRPWLDRPACSGVTLARRETRNSRTSARLSTPLTVRRAAARWDALSVHPQAGSFPPAPSAAFLAVVTTAIRHTPRRRPGAAPTAVALVGLLAVLVALLADPRGGNSAAGVSGRTAVTPSGSASIAPAAAPSRATSIRSPSGSSSSSATRSPPRPSKTPPRRTTSPPCCRSASTCRTASVRPRPANCHRWFLDDSERSQSYAAGELAYWTPSARIAVVYDTVGRSVPPPGLVRLGTVDTRLPAIASAGNNFTMTVRRSQ